MSIASDYRIAKQTVLKAQILQHGYNFCQSCLLNNYPLSISHIISRKRCKEINREDLIADVDNLLIQCYEAPTSNPVACHNLYEIDILKCWDQETYEYAIKFIHDNDHEQYRKLAIKAEERGISLPV